MRNLTEKIREKIPSLSQETHDTLPSEIAESSEKETGTGTSGHTLIVMPEPSNGTIIRPYATSFLENVRLLLP